jgi:hypothetical protein
MLPESGPEAHGCFHRYGHMYDVAMMVGTNGRSRTPSKFGDLGQMAGLEVKKVWECKGHGGLVELRLPDA